MSLRTMYGWGAVLAVALLVGIMVWGFAAPPLPAAPTPQPTPLQLPPPEARVPLVQTAIANMRVLTSAHWTMQLVASDSSGMDIWQYEGDSDLANNTNVFSLVVNRPPEDSQTPVSIGPPMPMMVRDGTRYYGDGTGAFKEITDTGDHFEFIGLYMISDFKTSLGIPTPQLPITTTLLPGTPEIETLDGVTTFHFVAPQTVLMFGQLIPVEWLPDWEGETSQVELWVAPGARPLLYQVRWSAGAAGPGMTVLWRGSRFDAPVPFQTPVIQETATP